MTVSDEHFAEALHLYEQGQQAMSNEEFEDAVALLQQSVEKFPHFKTLELLGVCLMHLERWKAAIVPLSAATTLNKSVRAPSLLCEVLLQLGEVADAEAIADLALGRDKNNRIARNVKELIRRKSHTPS